MDRLLQKLKKVRYSGQHQAMACCPAHDDRSPSLSIKDAGGGRILLNCLAGCATEDVLSAIGLTFADIQPEKRPTETFKPVKDRVYATDALKAIQYEAQFVMMCAMDMKKGRQLSTETYDRLELSMERINRALELANVH